MTTTITKELRQKSHQPSDEFKGFGEEENISEKMPILGSHKIKGFNNGKQGEINLEDFWHKDLVPPPQYGAKFSHITVLDLDDVDEDDDIWLNPGIREEGNTEERFESFKNSFEVQGFKTSYVPPILYEDGTPQDGRGRIIGAKRGGEKYIPVYVYIREEDPELCRITNGLKSNLTHDPSYKATMESVISGGLCLMKQGKLEHNPTAIDYWLKHILKVQEDFAGHVVTKIADSLFKRGVGGGDPLVLVQDRKVWVKWCQDRGISIDDKQIFLTSVDNETYPYRSLCQHILKCVRNNKSPAQIVLYTNSHIPNVARTRVKKFVKDLDKEVNTAYLMVIQDFKEQIPVMKTTFAALFSNKTPPYEMLGAVPQIIGNENHGNSLVSVDDY